MTTATDFSERRRYPRVALHRTVTVRLARWSSLEVMGHDISQGGIRLSLPVGVNRGDRISIGLTLPNELQLQIEAEVCFVQSAAQASQCIAGLQFVQSSAETIEILGQVIEELGQAS